MSEAVFVWGDGTGIWGFLSQRCGFVAENGGVGWRCNMEYGIFVATVFGGVLEIWVCRGLIGMFVGGHKWLMTRLSGWRDVKEYES